MTLLKLAPADENMGAGSVSAILTIGIGRRSEIGSHIRGHSHTSYLSED
jgi:hypothetical protein